MDPIEKPGGSFSLFRLAASSETEQTIRQSSGTRPAKRMMREIPCTLFRKMWIFSSPPYLTRHLHIRAIAEIGSMIPLDVMVGISASGHSILYSGRSWSSVSQYSRGTGVAETNVFLSNRCAWSKSVLTALFRNLY